jgi:hypothetical protein
MLGLSVALESTAGTSQWCLDFVSRFSDVGASQQRLIASTTAGAVA